MSSTAWLGGAMLLALALFVLAYCVAKFVARLPFVTHMLVAGALVWAAAVYGVLVIGGAHAATVAAAAATPIAIPWGNRPLPSKGNSGGFPSMRSDIGTD
jgi:hypothetical protein